MDQTPYKDLIGIPSEMLRLKQYIEKDEDARAIAAAEALRKRISRFHDGNRRVLLTEWIALESTLRSILRSIARFRYVTTIGVAAREDITSIVSSLEADAQNLESHLNDQA